MKLASIVTSASFGKRKIASSVNAAFAIAMALSSAVAATDVLPSDNVVQLSNVVRKFSCYSESGSIEPHLAPTNVPATYGLSKAAKLSKVKAATSADVFE